MNLIRMSRPPSSWLLSACGLWLIGLGFYFVVMRPPLLPEDARFMRTTLDQLRDIAPSFESWLRKVFIVMGGFMAGAGVLTLFLGIVSVPQRAKGTSWAIAASGMLSVGVMSATNFALSSDFRWLLLGPALMWLAGLVLFMIGR